MVGKPKSIHALQDWATQYFNLASTQSWRTITPLTRSALPPALENVLLAGDAARVVEPFTGEGIYYALRSGELAAIAIVKIIRGEDRRSAIREFTRAHRAMYRGRLWINRVARAAVLSPRFASQLVGATFISAPALRSLTRQIVIPVGAPP
jgi:flavin-dependent dehydrogenase